MSKIKLCIVITASSHLWALYRDQFLYLQQNGFEITAVASPGPEHKRLREHGIRTVAIAMKKTPAPINDLISFFRIFFFFLRNRYDIVSISTPKASLLGGLAAFFTRQKKIIFTIRGRVYENKTGFSRRIFENIDHLICAMSDSVFSISKEIMKDFIAEGLCPKEKIFVIGSGSSNGVDLRRFTNSDELAAKGHAIRKKHGIPDEAVCILYSGRIRRDKGINELVAAFREISKDRKHTHLLIQGVMDHVDSVDPVILQEMENNPLIHRDEWCEDVEKYFAAADIFAFPSHREGFGNVAIEASAMKLPVVAFDVVGARESVVDNQTGILCPQIDVGLLRDALIYLVDKPGLRLQMGMAGRRRIESEFESTKIWDALIKIYRALAAT